MSYLIQSKMGQDYGLIMRIAACAATEGVPGNAASWADDRRQRIVATDGWATEYGQALADERSSPGEDETVITDEMILDAVRAVILAEQPEPLPDPAE